MKLKRSLKLSPVSSLRNSWNLVNSCKFFIPCEGLIDGRLREIKRDVRINPQEGFAFEYDSSLKGVRATANFAANSIAVQSGTFGETYAGKYYLFMFAGYVDEAPNAPGNLHQLRCSIAAGESSQFQFGISDTNSHVIAQAANASYASNIITPQTSTGQTIYDAIGNSGHFFRYALTRPNIFEMESGAYNTTTGALIIANNNQYGSGELIASAPFSTMWRMSGSTNTGILMLEFDTVPENYITLMILQALEWQRGNKIVLPYWDQ